MHDDIKQSAWHAEPYGPFWIVVQTVIRDGQSSQAIYGGRDQYGVPRSRYLTGLEARTLADQLNNAVEVNQ